MRKVWQAALFFLWMFACFVVLFPPMVLFPTRAWRLRMAHVFARTWSRGCLWLAGIKLEVEGREHLKVPAIFLFNHTSNLDFFVNSIFAPYGTLVFGKRELGRVPMLGWVWLLSGHPLIRRDDRDDWQRKLDWVATELKTNRYATIVAPEGKRNHGGGLLPFKKGPFHLALQSGAPIVPCVLMGAAPLLTGKGMFPGTVRVRVLPPMRTTTWTPETLDDRIEEVRRLYLDALGPQPSSAAS